jgi:hypothetical protein
MVTFVTIAALIGASRCLAKLLLSGSFFVIHHPRRVGSRASAVRRQKLLSVVFGRSSRKKSREPTINNRLRAVKIKLLLRSGLP